MTRSNRCSKNPCLRGFTLIEVILALAIISFIMVAAYGTLFTTVNARDEIEKESLEAKIGPAILDMIERDVAGAWCMNIHNNDVFLGEDSNVMGEPADRFHLITTTNSTIVELKGEEPVRSDLTEVSYLLRQNPQTPDLMELYRRQDFHVDDKIAEGGTYELVYSRIRSMDIHYYKTLYEGADDFDEWDAKVRNCLPAAMTVALSLEIDPRLAGYDLTEMQDRPRRQDFSRVIFFPQGSQLTMAVRPVIPVYVEPQTDAGGAGSGAFGAGAAGKGGGQGQTGGEGKGLGEDMEGGIQGKGGNQAKDGGFFKPGDGIPDLPKPPPGNPNEPPIDDKDLNELLKLLSGQ